MKSYAEAVPTRIYLSRNAKGIRIFSMRVDVWSGKWGSRCIWISVGKAVGGLRFSLAWCIRTINDQLGFIWRPK